MLEFFQFHIQLVALDFDPALVVVALAQRHDVAAQPAQLFQSFGGIIAAGEEGRNAVARRAVRKAQLTSHKPSTSKEMSGVKVQFHGES